MMSEEIRKYLIPGKKNIILIYGLYLCGLVYLVLPFVGAAFAYSSKDHPDDVLRSHYLFAFRTFYLSFAGFLVSLVLTFIFVGVVMYVIVLVWSIARSICALQLLLQGMPHPNPLTYNIR